MSTYSTNLALELIGTGEQAGTWGNTTNTNLGTLIEQAISGYVTQAVATGTDTTLTIPNGATGVARNMYIELTGTGGTNTNLIVPSNKKLYFIYNNSTGAVTVKVSGQTGVSVAATEKKILVSNGTDIVEATSYITAINSSLTLTTLNATSANITTLSGTAVNYGSATISTVNATTVNATNVEVTNVKAKDGTAAIVISNTSGNVGIGGTANGAYKLNVLGTYPSGSNTTGVVIADGTIPSASTTASNTFVSVPSTQAASFTVSNLRHFYAVQGTIGAGSAVTNQVGFLAESNLTGATNNFGFYSNIASGSNRWNFYANGTAANYFAGNTGFGTTSLTYNVEVAANTNTANGLRITNANTGSSAASALYFGTDIDGTMGYIAVKNGAGTDANQLIVANRVAHGILFRTNDTNRMYIDSSGNVGIGTTTTTLSGTAFKAAISNSGFGIFGLNNSNNTNQSWGLFIGDSGAGTAGRFHLCQIVNGSGSGIAGGPAVPIISADVPTTANTTSRILIAADGVVSDQYGKIRAIPRTGSEKTSAYTLTVSDVGQYVQVGTSGSVTVPNNTFATGDVVSVFNNTTGNVTLTMSITTAYIGGTNTDKDTITLATRGVATILFISGTVCVVNGNVS